MEALRFNSSRSPGALNNGSSSKSFEDAKVKNYGLKKIKEIGEAVLVFLALPVTVGAIGAGIGFGIGGPHGACIGAIIGASIGLLNNFGIYCNDKWGY